MAIFLNPITHTPISPKFEVPTAFNEALSYTDQILLLANYTRGFYDALQTVEDSVNSELDNYDATINNFMAQVKAELDAISDELDKIVISDGHVGWAVYEGAYTNEVDATRGNLMYAAVHALTVEELAATDYTVSTLAAGPLNVEGVAYYGRYLVDEGLPLPKRLGNVSDAGRSFTAGDLGAVKKKITDDGTYVLEV